MNFFISILFIIFLSLGIVLDVSNKPKPKDVIFSLSNEETNRFRKAIKLYEKSYSTNEKIYFCTTPNILNFVFKNDKILRDKKKHLKKITLIKNTLNTFEEIQNIEKEIKKKNIASAIIVTDPPHSLRVKIFIELFTTKLRRDYIIVSSEPDWWNKNFYFTNLYSIKFVFSEIVKIPYNLIKYTLFF